MRVTLALMDLKKVDVDEISEYIFRPRGIRVTNLAGLLVAVSLYLPFFGDPHTTRQWVQFLGFTALAGIGFLSPLFRYTRGERFRRDVGYYLYIWRDLQGMPVYAVSSNDALPPIPAARVVIRVALGGKNKTSAILTPAEKELVGEMVPTWDAEPVPLRHRNYEIFQYQESTLTTIGLTSREIFWLYDHGVFPDQDILTALMVSVAGAEKKLAVRDAEFQQLSEHFQNSADVSAAWYATILRLQTLASDLTMLSYGLLRGLADKKWVKAGEGAQRLKLLGAKRLRQLLQAKEEDAKIDPQILTRVLHDVVLMESLAPVPAFSDGVADVAFGSTIAEQSPTADGSQAA